MLLEDDFLDASKFSFVDGGASISVKEIDIETRIPKGISENAKRGRIKFIIIYR